MVELMIVRLSANNSPHCPRHGQELNRLVGFLPQSEEAGRQSATPGAWGGDSGFQCLFIVTLAMRLMVMMVMVAILDNLWHTRCFFHGKFTWDRYQMVGLNRHVSEDYHQHHCNHPAPPHHSLPSSLWSTHSALPPPPRSAIARSPTFHRSLSTPGPTWQPHLRNCSQRW